MFWSTSSKHLTSWHSKSKQDTCFWWGLLLLSYHYNKRNTHVVETSPVNDRWLQIRRCRTSSCQYVISALGVEERKCLKGESCSLSLFWLASLKVSRDKKSPFFRLGTQTRLSQVILQLWKKSIQRWVHRQFFLKHPIFGHHLTFDSAAMLKLWVPLDLQTSQAYGENTP